MKALLLSLILGVAVISIPTEEKAASVDNNTFYFETQQVPISTVVFQFNSSWNTNNRYQWVETPKAKYFEVDIDKDPASKARYGIKSVPTIIIFKGGKEFKRYEGGLQMKITTPVQEIHKNL